MVVASPCGHIKFSWCGGHDKTTKKNQKTKKNEKQKIQQSGMKMAWLRLPVPSHPGQHPTVLPLPPPRGLGQGPGPGAAGRGPSGVLAGAPEALGGHGGGLRFALIRAGGSVAF